MARSTEKTVGAGSALRTGAVAVEDREGRAPVSSDANSDTARRRTNAGTEAGRPAVQQRMATYIILAILLVLIAAPLLSVLVTAFTGYRDEPSALGVLAHGEMLTVMGNTVFLSVLVVLFATVMAAPLAVSMAWTPLSRHSWIDVVVMVPFMTPPFAAAMAWMDFTRLGGVAEQLFGKIAGSVAHDVIYSVWGMALIMACELFPFLYLLCGTRFPPFRRLSSRLHGSRARRGGRSSAGLSRRA